MTAMFEELRDAIPKGDVLLPGDKGYEESIFRWSATCIKRAAVVVRPTSSEETSVAIKFATQFSIPFVVRGGGHSPSGASASEGGMVIDLSNLRSVTVDKAVQTVTFGGGCTWADVDDKLWEHRLATVGGTVSHTGVGGLILGGGFGILTGRYGLCIDNLLSCEVVLADGRVLTASDNENEDLFWAIRGAGHSFGVVTSFTSRCFPQQEAWGGLMAWPTSRIPEVTTFINEFAENNDGDQHMLVMLACHPKTAEPCIAVTLFYNGGKEAAEKFYEPLLKLEGHNVDTTGVIPYPKANTFPEPKVPHGKRYLFSGANFQAPLDVATVQQASDKFHAAFAQEGNDEMKYRSMIGFELAPHAKVKKVPAEATAFAGRTSNAYNIVIVVSWDNEQRDEAAKALTSDISTFLKDRGWQGDALGDRGGTYYNYLNPATEADGKFLRAERVFGPNIGRLRELKYKYDPLNAFKQKVDLLAEASTKALTSQ